MGPELRFVRRTLCDPWARDRARTPECPPSYDNHVEIAYCIEGEAVIRESGGGEAMTVRPGTMWIAEKGDRFSFVANVPTRLICVFTPPFQGGESGFAGDQ